MMFSFYIQIAMWIFDFVFYIQVFLCLLFSVSSDNKILQFVVHEINVLGLIHL